MSISLTGDDDACGRLWAIIAQPITSVLVPHVFVVAFCATLFSTKMDRL